MLRPSGPVILSLLVLATVVPSFTGIGPRTASAVAGAHQICTPESSNPVLNDSGPYVVHAFTNYTAYSTHYDYSSVLKIGRDYLMWFSGAVKNVSGIFTANSSDGLHWSVNNVPVLRPGANGTWDSGVVYSPNVIWNGTMYLLYYSATGTHAFRQIGVAYSTDNLNWVKYANNPILKAGPGFYDSWFVRYPSVMLDGHVYKMWYTGHTLTNTRTQWYIGVDYAFSYDGLHWTKYAGNPVLNVYSQPNAIFNHPSVVKVNNTYVMTADNGEYTSYATSTDGLNWTVSSDALVTPVGAASWENNSAAYSSAVLNGSKILLWYSGYGGDSHGILVRPPGIGLAYCNFLLIPSMTTTTETSVTTASPSTTSLTSTLTTTLTTTLTSTTVSNETRVTTLTTSNEGAIPIGAQPIVLVAVVVLGVSTLALSLLRARSRNHH